MANPHETRRGPDSGAREHIEGVRAPIRLLTKEKPKSTYTTAEIRELFPGYNGPIITTDFVITPQVDKGETKEPVMAGETLVGFRYRLPGSEIGEVISIDHHDEDPRMQRFVSSGNLAALYMEHAMSGSEEYPANVGGILSPYPVVISHTDCDSVVAAAILAGRVGPKDYARLGQSVVAADHTGAADPIADVLQELDRARETTGTKDPEFAISVLESLLAGQPISGLPQEAQAAYAARTEQRQRAAEFISQARQDPQGNVYGEGTTAEGAREIVGRLKEVELTTGGNSGVYVVEILGGRKIPTELLSGLLPDAVAIVQVSPAKGDETKTMREVSIRAGMHFPQGGNFHNIDIAQFKIGGRWNAGSSGRSGGNTAEEAMRAVQYIADNASRLSRV